MTCRRPPSHGTRRSHQAGQSMTEFIAALAVLLPLFLAVTYAGRYSDLQQTAVQASRYAAMQRAIEPNTGRLSDAVLTDQTRTRFLVHGTALNQGRLQSDDALSKVPANAGEIALWQDVSGKRLLDKRTDMTLGFANAGLAGSSTIGQVAKLSTGKNYGGSSSAQVELKLLNRMNLFDQTPAPLYIGAATAAVGDRWNTQGNSATVKVVERTLVTSALEFLNPLLDFGTDFFEGGGHSFELGCVKPDEVPGLRLKGAASVGGCQ
ncbi:TadE family protein [Ideonella sp.]|uniref:TadE family protein n=1 Tax=Ideonella sp. TaxID=1929293 RepID=UPI003BB521FD